MVGSIGASVRLVFSAVKAHASSCALLPGQRILCVQEHMCIPHVDLIRIRKAYIHTLGEALDVAIRNLADSLYVKQQCVYIPSGSHVFGPRLLLTALQMQESV